MASCSGATPMPRICSEPVPSGIGKPRGSLPNVKSTRLSTTMPIATVAISHALEPRFANGRMATSSTTMP